jgi:hydrogenase-4 component F
VAGAPHMPKIVLWTGFLLILVGFGTKVGLVPLHTWLPDAHSQAPSPICALLSGVETSTVLFVIMRMFPVLQAAPLVQDPRPWFITVGLVSVGTAAFLLLRIRDYKRMFAFSTVEHMGIIMVAVGLGGLPAHIAAVYQLTAHSLSKSFCFFAAGSAVVATGTQEVGAVRGLIKTSPAAGAALLLGGLAIAGAPPFAVFISEFSILKAGLANGQYLAMALFALFIAIAFCALTYHVNRIVFGKPIVVSGAPVPALCRTALLVAIIPMLVLGVYLPGPLATLFRSAAAALGK